MFWQIQHCIGYTEFRILYQFPNQNKTEREYATLLSDQKIPDNQTLHKSYTHVTLMSPSTNLPPLAYLHLVTPSLTLGPASGDEGVFVALPLAIQAPAAVVDLFMLQ